ncbi:type II secretion system protein [Granulosicoccus antarcticus]|uniref:Type II secretion system protein H n=1 Tax=Granulosicoccus antarcticus IMCC3135 TaxID=1192854 RepID=A0A2Z2NYX4_9GAMM|nr:type II secretion system protein [Granulosicoccus antarcticus]ASJ76652.1 Putative type II secretion system protein H [Granulosicoccus antarcticus IMCC3135]
MIPSPACPPPTRRREQGFTLIELLVVVTIVSILVGAVVINIEFRNVGKIVRDTALRTGLLMELASDQAVYSRQQFGIRFHPESYEFYILTETEDDESVWEIVEDGQLKFRSEDVAIEFQVDISGLPIILAELTEELDDATEEDPLKPHIIFLSNGEIIPDFRIRISDPDGEYEHEVAAGEVLPIVVEQLEGS